MALVSGCGGRGLVFKAVDSASSTGAVRPRPSTAPAQGPRSKATVNLKRSIRDAEAEDRGAL